MPKQSVRLAPLGGQKSQRISDFVLDGVYMRGGFNVGVRDGEWWCRKGEALYDSTSQVRFASTPWWWVLDVDPNAAVIANPFWALLVTSSGCRALYAPAITEDLIVENGSQIATSATTRVINQLVMVDGAGGSDTSEVYRITAVSGSTVTLERPFEGITGTYSTDFIDPLPRNASGTAAAYSITSTTPIRGSAVVFEQLVSHTATALHAASPATTGGNVYLVITSAFGMPVAIDLTEGIDAPSAVGVLRLFFYNTALATPAQIADNTDTGLYAEVYKNRLFISKAPDNNGDFGDRTVWWSQINDLALWHTGISGQTAAGNFKTFDGIKNPITETKALGDEIVIHRAYSQEIGNATQSLAQPFVFRSNRQGWGIGDRTNFVSNRCVVANGVQYIWTQQGPAVFSGGRVSLIARDAIQDLIAYGMVRAPFRVDSVIHDAQLGLIYWIVNGVTHQDATAATTKTTRAGTTYLSRCTAWVYDYLSDVSWFEDHPGIYGGGMSEKMGDENTPIAIASRFDGTLVKLSAGDTGTDVDYDDPDDNAEVFPAAQCDTGWLNFGSNERKTIGKVEVALRGFSNAASASFDRMSDSAPDNAFFRMRIYGDLNESTEIADVDDIYDESAGTELVENKQERLILLRFTPKCSARSFKFRFSNTLTDAATAAGYDMAPFRISEVVVYFTQRESDQANSYANDE